MIVERRPGENGDEQEMLRRIERLLADPGIVRNRRKVEAAVQR